MIRAPESPQPSYSQPRTATATTERTPTATRQLTSGQSSCAAEPRPARACIASAQASRWRHRSAVITRTAHFESFTMSGTGYNDNARHLAAQQRAPARAAGELINEADAQLELAHDPPPHQRGGRPGARPPARKLSGWPKRCKLAHAFLREYS